MPRARSAKGPRLWLQPERVKPSGSIERAVWCIRDDGGFKLRTGFGFESRGEAEDALAEYIAEKRLKRRPRDRRAADVMVADVIAIYATDVAPGKARPKEAAGRLERLLAWWGSKTLDQVTGASCRAYAAHRGVVQAARRELEDLRAAINYHRREGLCRDVVEVTLPEKSQPREKWLTRSEAAAMIWQAWRYREVQKGKDTDRRTRRHVARFILIGLYTGTRAGAICSASFKPEEGRGWIDTERGVFYRRPAGERETKKRRPPIRIPERLLAHFRRWESLGMCGPVEFNGKPVKDVDKAFRNVAADAGIEASPHTLRHTAVTWAMQNGADLYEAAGYFGMTIEVLQSVYGHHHPEHQGSVGTAVTGGQRADRKAGTKREQLPSNVIKIA